ncbi:Ig-like domain-containing protein [uncultured Methanobrevibacter sp.]|uniref:Ig-like domain-containing protein n=1 Tax=uncultured Methanobrevibacter sp. TaxID=253161 RepID=UPI002632BEE6|nr:Ig-like domain repeat protein [uncultured Methanobrevibacter sp.]
MKKTALLLSVVLMFFLLIGTISASELNNATSTDNSNLNVNQLSSNMIEESPLGDSVSDENILNSAANKDDVQISAGNTSKDSTKISVSPARYSQSHTVFKIVLTDSNGNLLENKTISFKINSKTYSATTKSNGAAYVTVNSLKKGSYTATATFKGDDNYEKSSYSGAAKVWSSISGRIDLVKTYGVEKYYEATFWKDNARLANTNVKFTLNGKTYTVKTDSQGVGKLATNLNPGKYTIKLYNPYSKETTSNTITVNKDSSKITGAKNTYILPKTKYSYSITLKSGQGNAIKNAKITFRYNSNQVTASTDANGKATITIPALSKGTYTLSYQYSGDSRYNSVSGSKKLYVTDSTTTLKSSPLKMEFRDGSKFSVKATDSSGKPLTNKDIKFTLNKQTTTSTTNSNGVAELSVGNLKPGTYTVKYSYSTEGLSDYNTQSNTITISKQTLTLTANDLVMKYNDGSSFVVNVKNKTGGNHKNGVVQFTINGKTSQVTTDANGNAKLPITENIGYYQISAQTVETTYTKSPKITKYVLVNGTRFVASDMAIPVGTSGEFSVKLIDGQNKPVVSKTVKFTLNSKTQSVQTDASGIAKLPVSGLAKGTYTVTYTDGSASGTSKISVADKVSLKDVITASQNVKKFIEANGELPATVSIGGTTYSTAVFVYLASQAIINLDGNKKTDIDVKNVNNPTSPQAATNLGNLYDYLSVAKSIVNTANSKGTMPDSVSSKVGTIGYNGLVYAIARVVAFYGDYSIMPNYVTIKTYGSSSSSSSLNSKNTITDLKPYLAASTNCQVGNAAIKSLVNSLTSGLTSDTAKATAIYNYVRDSVSYSFYYNTKYGAVGTLNAKTGNCVDQSHLLIAMYRTANLPARYVHGTCVFSSGSTYGHVWTQVLIGDTWIVADPTSTRNSFGKVVNWNNNNNYQLKGYFPSIAF